MRSGLGVPPEKGYNLIFGGLIEAIGVVVLLILWINRGKLQKLTVRRVTRIVVGLIITLICFLLIYLSLFKFCVVTHDPRGTVYYPLWTTGEVTEMIEHTGGRWAAIDSYGRYAAYSGVEKMGPFPALLTTTTLLFLYLGIFTTLTLALGILVFYEKSQ